MKQKERLIKSGLLFLIIGGFSMSLFAGETTQTKSGLNSDEINYLARIEKATFLGFQKLIDPATEFPVDIADVSTGEVLRQPNNPYFSKTSPTNIGLGFLYVVLARERGYLKTREAHERIVKMLDFLEKLETHEGFLYNWYYLNGKNGEIPQVSEDRFISSLDNGDLDISLMATAGAFSGTEIEKRIDAYFEKKNYRFFYGKNPSDISTEMINVGFDQDKKTYRPVDYSIFNIEGRMTSFIAILKDGLPDSVWTHMSRLVKTYKTAHGKKIAVVAPWGGSLYETLFADEILGGFKVAPRAFKKNAEHMIEIHQDYGKRISKSGIWGFSNGEVPGENKYEMAGVPDIAYNRFPGKFVTIYSSFLSLRYAPKATIQNLKNMEDLNPKVFNPSYGFTDSIDPETGAINRNVLSLDKGMEFLSIANFMNALEGKKEVPNFLWTYFKTKGWTVKARSLLKAEEKNSSFQSIHEKEESQFFSNLEKKMPPLDLLEARQDLGTFYEPGRANASFKFLDSKKAEGQVIATEYDVSKRYSFAGLYLKFDELDISGYRVLSLDLMGNKNKGYPKTLKAELKYKGRYVAFDHITLKADWNSVNIALPPGKKMMDEVAFVFENAASTEHPIGEVQIKSLYCK